MASSVATRAADIDVSVPDGMEGRSYEVLAQLLEDAVGAGRESLRRGPSLLPVLRDAGVVDAGAYGLVLLVAGIVGTLREGEAPEVEHQSPAFIICPEWP
jgi:dihydroxyacetone kinase-like predicted kinase